MEVEKEHESAAAGPGDDAADVPEANAHPSDDASPPSRPATADELAKIVQALGDAAQKEARSVAPGTAQGGSGQG